MLKPREVIAKLRTFASLASGLTHAVHRNSLILQLIQTDGTEEVDHCCKLE